MNANSEGEIRTLIENWAKAVRAKDIDGVTANHTDDIVMLAKGQMRSLLIIALCFSVASCGYRGRAATGTVLEVTNFEAPSEEWKFRALKGAEIALYWEGYRALYSHGGRAYCLAITYTTSNADGRFHVEGWTMPRVVSGITDITPVSLAYMPGFVQLRPHEHKNSIWETSSYHPHVHVFRRAQGSNAGDLREDALYNAKFCPSKEFLEANTYEPP